ncbi:MAG: trypsin-like peptidase domain-containing protein [Chloroflexota bacterium]|nr:trypsin-like peptidase domain-containing protein [Chloroflexota bacterium]
MARLRLALLATLLSLLLAGCGGAGDRPEVDETVPTDAAPAAGAARQGGEADPPGVVGGISESDPGTEEAGASVRDVLPSAAPGSELNAVAVVDRVRPAVVTVVNEQRTGGFASDAAQEAGRGTGFAVDGEGHVVTNEHVVRNGDRFHVILADGEKRPATLVGADPLSDLAVVRVDEGVPATVPFGDSDGLQVGQPVLAIGSPLGEFTNTATDGIVGGLGRDFPGAPNRGEPGYSNLIQHNAAINPGNSGGPLLNAAAEVVGVNTLGIPRTEQGLPAQGLFFAIPANTVRGIAAQLIETGRVAYPSVGVDLVPITEDLASQYGLPVDHGVFVRAVAPDGPAARAGIRQGDFLVALGGQRIDQENSFTEVLFGHRPGETVVATLQRDRDEVQVDVTLGERPDG